MKVPHLQLKSKSGVILVATAVVVGLGGWAFAEGGVPLLSSPTADTAATTSTTTTTALSSTPGAGTDSAAVASNTKDGKTVIAISLKIVHTNGPTVDPTNAAVAVASCSDCQTVAISLEGVLVAGSPTTFDPTNVALAINTDCSNCQTLATAYQDVVQNDTRVRITGAGRQEIASIRRDLESLRNSGLDIFAIQQQVNTDAGRFLTVLQNDVVPIGKPPTSTSTTTSTTSPSPSTSTSTTSTTPAAPTSTSTSSTTSTTRVL